MRGSSKLARDRGRAAFRVVPPDHGPVRSVPRRLPRPRRPALHMAHILVQPEQVVQGGVGAAQLHAVALPARRDDPCEALQRSTGVSTSSGARMRYSTTSAWSVHGLESVTQQVTTGRTCQGAVEFCTKSPLRHRAKELVRSHRAQSIGVLVTALRYRRGHRLDTKPAGLCPLDTGERASAWQRTSAGGERTGTSGSTFRPVRMVSDDRSGSAAFHRATGSPRLGSGQGGHRCGPSSLRGSAHCRRPGDGVVGDGRSEP